MRATLDDKQQKQVRSSKRNNKKNNNNKKKKQYTLGDLSQDVVNNPAKYTFSTGQTNARNKKKPNYKRTRRKVEQPQQTYVYAAQRRRALEQVDGNGSGATATSNTPSVLEQARGLGLVVAQQSCDAATAMDDLHYTLQQPTILGEIRVSQGQDSSAMAYLIDKPAGWAVIGGAKEKKTPTTTTLPDTAEVASENASTLVKEFRTFFSNSVERPRGKYKNSMVR